MNLLPLLLMLHTAAPIHVADAGAWHDTYYQYRIPIEVNADAAGWQQLPLDPAAITEAINATGPFKYDPLFFSYDDVMIVDADGRAVEAGFYLVLDEKERAGGALDADDDFFKARVTPHVHHLLRYTSSQGGKSPLNNYEAIFAPDSPLFKTHYKISFFPPQLPQSVTQREELFIPDRPELKLLVGGRFATNLHALSVRRAEIRLCVNVKHPGAGKQNWTLYYQPMGSHHLHVPQKRMDAFPQTVAKVDAIGAAQTFIGDTQYRVADDALAGVSFAASTVKVTRHTPVPFVDRAAVDLRCAANEAQSFQLLITPKQPVSLIGVDVTSPQGLPDDAVTVRAIDYVPISRSSFITPARYIGDVADALVAVEPGLLDPRHGHKPLWLTVRVPAETAAGTYEGSITVRLEGATLDIPLRVAVDAFELPRFASLETHLGGQFFVKTMRGSEPHNTVTRYHGIEPTPDNIRKLAFNYYDLMADNKFAPKSVAMHTEIGIDWSPPPKGYDVDEPGNLFTIDGWDFTEYNKTLSHYIDEKNLANVCILHTNPRTCNVFMMMPGEPREQPNNFAPFIVQGNQMFREPSFFAYGEVIPGYRDQVTMITKTQWEDLVMKYFRGLAQNLDEHGWLDRVHILIDEQEHAARLEHFLRLLKSDPLTARIQVVACVQSTTLIDEMSEHDPSQRRFAGLIDTYVPEVDENYDRWQDYYFDDYNIPRDRTSLWLYAVTTSRLAIDTPGINNRTIGLDVFRRGGSGYLIWDTFAWQHAYGPSENPWVDPWTRHANGSLALFYPPKRDGLATEPDWTVTPSLRLETFREASDDYDYAIMLETLRDDAKANGQDTTEADAVLADIDRMFRGNTHWTQNDAWLLDLRDRMADAIVNLKSK